MMGWRGWDAVDKGWGLSVRAVCICAALFDDGIEFADSLVHVCLCASQASRARASGVGAGSGW
jgi:hypothetical protein